VRYSSLSSSLGASPVVDYASIICVWNVADCQKPVALPDIRGNASV